MRRLDRTVSVHRAQLDGERLAALKPNYVEVSENYVAKQKAIDDPHDLMNLRQP
jgi:hypothetical protein